MAKRIWHKNAKTRIWVENVIMYIYPSRCAEPKCGSSNSFLATVTTSRAEPDTMGYKVKAAPHRSTAKSHARPLACTTHVAPGELNDSCWCSGQHLFRGEKKVPPGLCWRFFPDFPPGMLKMLWQMVWPIEEPERGYSLLNILHALMW